MSMRPPAEMALWLSTEDLQTWVREAPDKTSYQQRLAIWLTHMKLLSALRVAQSFCVSTPAVWRWVRQYNHKELRGFIAPGAPGSVGRF
jgi:transposase